MLCIHTISFLCGVLKREYAEISGSADKDRGCPVGLPTLREHNIYIQTMIGCCRSLNHLKTCRPNHGALVFKQAAEVKATQYGL